MRSRLESSGSGLVQWAFSFDGAGDRIDVATAPDGTSFTIEAWVYLNGDNSGYNSIYAGGLTGFWLSNRQLSWWDRED